MVKSHISKTDAKAVAKKLKLNLAKVKLDDWHYGLNIELEHGTVNPITNVTNNNLMKTAKITLAHLLEFPDYYKRLRKMELAAEKYWKKRTKPNLFL